VLVVIRKVPFLAILQEANFSGIPSWIQELSLTGFRINQLDVGRSRPMSGGGSDLAYDYRKRKKLRHEGEYRRELNGVKEKMDLSIGKNLH
jgi:hypothetical protein